MNTYPTVSIYGMFTCIYIYIFLLQETIIHVSDNISYTLEILGISINPPRLVNRSCWTPVTTQPLVQTQ